MTTAEQGTAYMRIPKEKTSLFQAARIFFGSQATEKAKYAKVVSVGTAMAHKVLLAVPAVTFATVPIPFDDVLGWGFVAYSAIRIFYIRHTANKPQVVYL